MNRTLFGDPSFKLAARGRPLGFSLTWMVTAHKYKDQKEHIESTYVRNPLRERQYDIETRREMRRWCKRAYPEFYKDVVEELERPRRKVGATGALEPEEPDGLA